MISQYTDIVKLQADLDARTKLFTMLKDMMQLEDPVDRYEAYKDIVDCLDTYYLEPRSKIL